jgi:hypothetical protein
MGEDSGDAPEPAWHLGPLSIKRTTDVLALVAFILSAVGIAAQVRDYLRGPHPILLASSQVTFGSSGALNVHFDDQFLITTAIMGYVNDAPTGFNAAVTREYIRFQIADKKYQYAAHQTVNTSSETDSLSVQKKDDSGPFALNAGSAVSHEVLFEPHPIKCVKDDPDCAGSLSAIRWSDFKTAVKMNSTISVTLLADILGKRTLSVRCAVILNDNDLKAFDKPNPHEQWAAPNCNEEEKGGGILAKALLSAWSFLRSNLRIIMNCWKFQL